MAAKTDVQRPTYEAWLARHAKQQVGMRALGSALAALGSVVLHFLTFGVLWMLVRQWIGNDAATPVVWTILALLHPLQWFTDKRQLERVEIDPYPNRAGAAIAAEATGNGFLYLLAGPKTFMNFVRVLAQCLLLAPGSAALAVRLAREALQWSGMDVPEVAKLLRKLFRAKGKLPTPELFADVPEDQGGPLLQQLLLVEGVLPLSGNHLTMGSELRETLVDWRVGAG